jgi:hypothetical protein
MDYSPRGPPAMLRAAIPWRRAALQLLAKWQEPGGTSGLSEAGEPAMHALFHNVVKQIRRVFSRSIGAM